MTDHHHLVRGLIFLLLIFVVLPLGIAQEGSDWSKWKYDKEKYVYRNGILTLPRDNTAGEAVIAYDYAGVGEETTWQLHCMWTRRPTSRNYFYWYLFTLADESEMRRYYVAPVDSGKGVALMREREERSSHSKRVDRLTTIALRSSLLDWEDLYIRVSKVQGQFTLQVTYGDGQSTVAEPYILEDQGRVIPRMILQAVYTKKVKEYMQWQLPTVTVGAAKAAEFKVTEVRELKQNLLEIVMDQPVETDELSVAKINGSVVAIRKSERRESIILHFPEGFKPGVEYSLELTRLKDVWGVRGDLSFKITGEEEQGDPITEIPAGVWITEVMSDPPAEGSLAGAKYIEIANFSGESIELSDFRLLYRSTKRYLPGYTLPHGAFFVLYDKEPGVLPEGVIHYSVMEGFPALSGSYDLALLPSTSTRYVDKVSITSHSYGYGFVKGGASMERITFGARDELWMRARAKEGGTPGKPSGIRAPRPVVPGKLIINELMLSPGAGGEKYLELHNLSSEPIELGDLYFAYRNATEGDYSYKYVIPGASRMIAPGGYAVITPFPRTLTRKFREVDPTTLIEYVDFPSFSSTYTEIEIRAHIDNSVVDRVIYRRQYLGEESKYRTGYALERRGGQSDGTQESAWFRASEASGGGTPGRANSIGEDPSAGVGGTWPEGSSIDYETMVALCGEYAGLCSLRVYDLLGHTILSLRGTQAVSAILSVSSGASALPSGLYIVVIKFGGEGVTHEVTYSDKWLIGW